MSSIPISRAYLCLDDPIITDEPACPICGSRTSLVPLTYVWPGATVQVKKEAESQKECEVRV